MHKYLYSTGVFACVCLLSLGAFANEEESSVVLTPQEFSETRTDSGTWNFDWHGYVRAPIAFSGSPLDVNPPYLLDDDYYESGFAYTRVNESEWAELYFQASSGRTRVVMGLFASQLSDYSNPSLPEQAGIATGFIEHGMDVGSWLDLTVRLGVFWDRFGYIEPYDTYLLGRTHVGGISMQSVIADWVRLDAGYGIHADFLSSNQGMTPLAWVRLGLIRPWLDTAGYVMRTWTTDSDRGFASQIEDGTLLVAGADARVAVPKFGTIYAGMSWVKARSIDSMSPSIELLHSTGGIFLTRNYLGEEEGGTGEILASGFDVQWDPAKSADWLKKYLDGVSVRLFGMSAWVLSKTQSDDPSLNRHDRLYFKWGGLVRYDLPAGSAGTIFASVRYDRVIMDMDHDDLSFRVLTPRLGITPLKGVDLFLSYSHYMYGDRIRLRNKQIKGDPLATKPDNHVFKLQAQASW